MESEYIYFLRKPELFWGRKRYVFTAFDTPGRARGAAKSSITQGGKPSEPLVVYRVPKDAFEEIGKYE
jgi:hypothetical protein